MRQQTLRAPLRAEQNERKNLLFRRKEDKVNKTIHRLKSINVGGEYLLALVGPILLILLSLGLRPAMKPATITVPAAPVQKIKPETRVKKQISHPKAALKIPVEMTVTPAANVSDAAEPTEPVAWHGQREILVVGEDAKEARQQFEMARTELEQICKAAKNGVLFPLGEPHLRWDQNITDNSSGYQMRQTFGCR